MKFYMWIKYANKRTICFFFVAFRVVELHSFIKSFASRIEVTGSKENQWRKTAFVVMKY